MEKVDKEEAAAYKAREEEAKLAASVRRTGKSSTGTAADSASRTP
jgi:hypothetical protein